MRWLILGALLGLLLAFPTLLATVIAATVTTVSKPLVTAFLLGLAARSLVARIGTWAR